MTEGSASERPVLWGQVGPPTVCTPNTGGGAKVNLPSAAAQGRRLGSRFTDLDNAFNEHAMLTQSLGASEPQLVVVFEGRAAVGP
jgi:hypothetical protein